MAFFIHDFGKKNQIVCNLSTIKIKMHKNITIIWGKGTNFKKTMKNSKK